MPSAAEPADENRQIVEVSLEAGVGEPGHGHVRHHLIDVVAPDGPFDAADYRTLALAAIAGLLIAGAVGLIAAMGYTFIALQGFDLIAAVGFVTDPDLEGSGILGATNWIFFTFTGEIAEWAFLNNTFSVTVTVTDDSQPPKSTEVDFSWIISKGEIYIPVMIH